MRFTVEHSFVVPGTTPDLYESDGVATFSRAVEEAGYHGIAFTEHPAPSAKWLHAGGHLTFDPLAALAFCAAITQRLRLITDLLVLPYHNPVVLAKTVATVDRLSAGRLIVGAGGGYLRSEFAAAGVEFERRGALLDEALDVLCSIWTGDSFSFEGKDFTALSVVSVPSPVQLPHPPIWIGGSGRNARRRVARVGRGWMPVMMGEAMASTTRTKPLANVADLVSAIGELRDMMAEAGRDPNELEVQLHTPYGELDADYSVEECRDHLGELAGAGVTDFVVIPPASSLAESTDALARFARDVAGLQGPGSSSLASENPNLLT